MSARALIVVMCNQKGGVGKTSLTAGLAGEAAKQGLRALVIDLAPQANATAWLAPALTQVPGNDDANDGDDSGDARTMNDVLYHANSGGALADAIVPSQWPGVDIAPSEQELASREADRVASAEFRLRRALRGADLSLYDLVLIDTDPNLGPLLMNALNAADVAIVVTDSERFGLTGVAYVIDTITVVQEEGNPRLHLAGIVMNKYDARVAEHAGRWKELQAQYGPLVLGRLPLRAAVSTACSGSVPVQSIPNDGAWPLGVKDILTHLLNLEVSTT